LRNKYLAIGLFLSLFISSVFASDVALVVKDANNLNIITNTKSTIS